MWQRLRVHVYHDMMIDQLTHLLLCVCFIVIPAAAQAQGTSAMAVDEEEENDGDEEAGWSSQAKARGKAKHEVFPMERVGRRLGLGERLRLWLLRSPPATKRLRGQALPRSLRNISCSDFSLMSGPSGSSLYARPRSSRRRSRSPSPGRCLTRSIGKPSCFAFPLALLELRCRYVRS